MGRWLLLAAALGVAIGQYVMPPWKGFNVVSYDTKSWTSTANSGAFDRLGDTGSNLAMIVASVFVSSPGSTSVVSDPALGSPSDSDFTVSAARAKAKGLMVGVKLRLEFSDRTTYRGLVGRDFASAADWATFFASYAAQVNRFASLAQSVGATVFCIGDQLGLTETQDSNWLSIISGVRSRFSGAVYYSMLPASSSVNPPSWMSSLDFLGASTAFSFAQLFTQLDAASMSNAWWSWNQAFARWYSSFGKKVLVDDLTFVPTSYAATYPNVPKMTGWPSLADWQQPLLGYQRELFYGSLMALNNQAYLQGERAEDGKEAGIGIATAADSPGQLAPMPGLRVLVSWVRVCLPSHLLHCHVRSRVLLRLPLALCPSRSPFSHHRVAVVHVWPQALCRVVRDERQVCRRRHRPVLHRRRPDVRRLAGHHTCQRLQRRGHDEHPRVRLHDVG